MADKEPGTKAATEKSSVRKGARKKTGVKTRAATKKTGTKAAAKTIVVKKISARKQVPIKTARVGKRTALPPLPPPPTAPLKSTRSPARASRAKAAARSQTVPKASATICEILTCTEVALREKLRLAAPYVELWMTRPGNANAELDLPTPEAAFVRLWQWLNLEAALDDGRVVTPDLLNRLFVEESGRLRPQ